DIHRTSFHNLIGGIHPRTRREYVHYEWSCGGNGAFAECDGASAMAAIDWGDLSTAQPTEVLESRYPLQIEWSRLGTDSGGEGARRGGLGMRRAIRLTGDEASYSLLSDGAVVPPFGILGGGAAAPVESFVLRDGETIRFATPGKVGGFPLRRGDVVVLQSAGGGGYGDPLEREPEAVLHDLAEGYVTPERARDAYGVVLGADGAVDAAATARQRRALRAARRHLRAVATDAPLYRDGRRFGRCRICPLHPADAAALGIAEGAMVELLGPGAAPLRAWAALDPRTATGTVPVDPTACGVLRVAAGEPVWVRPLLPPDRKSVVEGKSCVDGCCGGWKEKRGSAQGPTDIDGQKG